MKYSLLICLISFTFLNNYSEDAFSEFKVKRKEVFVFTKNPELIVSKNSAIIKFEVKEFCDVTVAVENAEGKIIRHLASGVLGKNAPKPFAKDSLEQTIVWDNKDDSGKYVDNLAAIKIRVSLGLQAEYERDLYYSPHKRVSVLPIMQVAPEGVYVFEGMGRDHVRLFGHDGKYIKTIYPFPASQVKNVIGLKWWDTPDGKKVFDKEGMYHNTLLTSGENDNRSDQKGRQGGVGATGLAVQGERMALTFEHLNRLATNGSSGGFPLKGGETGITISKGGYGGLGAGKQIIGPTSSVFSPDGKTLYMTGYSWQQRHGSKSSSLMAVMKMNFEDNESASVFAGVKSDSEFGTDENHFAVPTSVDVDHAGNVYVSDFGNNRIQIFSPAGKLLKSIAVKEPAKVAVHKKTGEVYVFSWAVIGLPSELEKKIGFHPKNVKQKIEIFSAFPELKNIKTDQFDFGPANRGYIYAKGQVYNLAFDSWGEHPAFWVVGRKFIPGPEDLGANPGVLPLDMAKLWEAGARKVELIKGKWEVVIELNEFAKKDLVRIAPTSYNIQQLYFNPKSELLYVGEPDSAPTMKAWTEMLEIDPKTAKANVVKLPINPQDMAFDLNGLLYLRTMNVLSRFDMTSWKEVPFDYGVEKESVGKDGGIGGVAAPIVSGIMLPAKNAVCYHQGGLSVNVNGDIAVACHNASVSSVNGEFKSVAIKDTAEYKVKHYPGRVENSTSVCVHVWNKFGKMISDDVVPGSPQTDGIVIDKDNNIYMLATPGRLIDGKPLDDGMSSTLIKFEKNAKGRFLTSSPKTQIVLDKSAYPKRKQELKGFWVENFEWMYGGCGFAGFNASVGCACWFVRFKLDYFARSFVPEPMQYDIAVLDSAGNLILKIGQYGNEDSKGKNSKEPLGGDEVGLFHPCFVEVHSDRRLFISDIGNENILSVKLKYAVDEYLTFEK